MNKIYRLFSTSVILFSSVFCFSSASSATSITWDLTCQIDDGVCTDSGLSFGTVTLDDNVTTVTDGSGTYKAIQVTISLANPVKIQSFALNFDNDLFDNYDDFRLKNDKDKDLIQVDEDSTSFISYKLFDLASKELAGVSPWTGTLYLLGTDLIVDYFKFSSGANNLYTAVHLADDFRTHDDDEDSIAVGSPGGNSVPEPATMLLFGTGIAGFAGMSRRRK